MRGKWRKSFERQSRQIPLLIDNKWKKFQIPNDFNEDFFQQLFMIWLILMISILVFKISFCNGLIH